MTENDCIHDAHYASGKRRCRKCGAQQRPTPDWPESGTADSLTVSQHQAPWERDREIAKAMIAELRCMRSLILDTAKVMRDFIDDFVRYLHVEEKP